MDATKENGACLAKEGIRLETLLNGQSITVAYPTKPLYEEPVEKHTQANKRDRKVCNQHLNVTWQNRCKENDEFSINCGDKTGEQCEQQASSLLCRCIGTEGPGIFKSKHPHFLIEKQSMKELERVL